MIETLVSHLPRNSIIYMRDEVADVDRVSFYQFVMKFTENVQDLTTNGRKVLLKFDSYRSHLLLRALIYSRDHGVIACALPAKTSGKTQPCDVTLFGSLKSEPIG